MLEVKFYDQVEDNLLKFAVIISQTDGKWVFCKHKDRVADIFSFEEIHSEIEEILVTETLVEKWTYPLIQPKLIEEAGNRGFL